MLQRDSGVSLGLGFTSENFVCCRIKQEMLKLTRLEKVSKEFGPEYPECSTISDLTKGKTNPSAVDAVESSSNEGSCPPRATVCCPAELGSRSCPSETRAELLVWNGVIIVVCSLWSSSEHHGWSNEV